METYLTIEGLAEYLKVAEQTVRRWVLNREVPFRKIKKMIRFRVSEIEKWIDNGGLILANEKQKDIGGCLFNEDVPPEELPEADEAQSGESAETWEAV